MKRKGASLLLFFLCLLLSGCDADLMTDNQRLDAVNEAFAEYGYKFNLTEKIPEMPDGAVVAFDADNYKQEITEVYLAALPKQALESNSYLFFVCEQEKILIVMTRVSSPIPPKYYLYHVLYSLDRKDYLVTAMDYMEYRGPEYIKNALLYIQNIDEWTEQTELELAETYDMYPGEMGEISRFLFDQTRDPDSPYNQVNSQTSDAAIQQMFYESYRETQMLSSSFDLPIVPVGNQIDKTSLSGQEWRVYDTQGRASWDNTESGIRQTMDLIIEDLFFLLGE